MTASSAPRRTRHGRRQEQYRPEYGVSLIEIRLSTTQPLFNSFDPAPFNEQDLDQEAEDYITKSARELPIATPLKLVLHVPAQEITVAHDAASKKPFTIFWL